MELLALGRVAGDVVVVRVGHRPYLALGCGEQVRVGVLRVLSFQGIVHEVQGGEVARRLQRGSYDGARYDSQRSYQQCRKLGKLDYPEIFCCTRSPTLASASRCTC